MASALPKVLFTLKVPAEQLSPLDGVAEVIMAGKGVKAAPREQVLEMLPQCSGVISQGELRINAALLDAAPLLKIAANAAMGIDNLDLAELKSRGIVATNTPDAFAISTADHTMGLLLNLTRRIAETDRFVRTGDWARGGMEPLRWESRLASSMTLGLIGYGRIAKLVEQRAKAFGMNVIHTRSKPDDHEAFRPLDTLLAEADVIVILVPLTPETNHIISEATLSKMKPGAFLINMARGKVMHEAAVVEALQSGHLAGAAFDVFEEEPIVNEALFTMDNVVLTPHIAGATKEQRGQGRREAAENVARYLKGEPLLNPL
jgi:glyoxylate reductase